MREIGLADLQRRVSEGKMLLEELGKAIMLEVEYQLWADDDAEDLAHMQGQEAVAEFVPSMNRDEWLDWTYPGCPNCGGDHDEYWDCITGYDIRDGDAWGGFTGRSGG